MALENAGKIHDQWRLAGNIIYNFVDSLCICVKTIINHEISGFSDFFQTNKLYLPWDFGESPGSQDPTTIVKIVNPICVN